MTIATNLDPITNEKKLALASQLELANQQLASLSAEQRVAWTLENLPQQVVLSSSFGIQAAVMLHLVTQQAPCLLYTSPSPRDS